MSKRENVRDESDIEEMEIKLGQFQRMFVLLSLAWPVGSYYA